MILKSFLWCLSGGEFNSKNLSSYICFASFNNTWINGNKQDLIFMFNPFGLTVMRRVLENIYKSYSDNPRIITLVYKNPVYNKEILEDGIFHKLFESKTESMFNFIIYRTL